MSMGRFRGQDGNITILMIAFCMGIALLMVLFLDFVSVLYTRHAAQTAADGAVLGALRVAQRVIRPMLSDRVQEKIRQWDKETTDMYKRQRADWQKARDDACPVRAPAPAEEPADPTAPDPPSRPECLADWDERHPAPVLEEIQRAFLEARIDDPAVVRAILYGEGVVGARLFMESVLSTQEILCTIRQARTEIETLGRTEAANYAQWNKAKLTTLVVPYKDLPQVLVRVERPVPTLILGKYGTTALKAERVALATLVSVKDAQPIPDVCP